MKLDKTSGESDLARVRLSHNTTTSNVEMDVVFAILRRKEHRLQGNISVEGMSEVTVEDFIVNENLTSTFLDDNKTGGGLSLTRAENLNTFVLFLFKFLVFQS